MVINVSWDRLGCHSTGPQFSKTSHSLEPVRRHRLKMHTAKFNVHVFYVLRTRCICVFWVGRETNFYYSCVINIFLMKAFPFCLPLHKLHLLIRTQKKAILISVFTFSSQNVALTQLESKIHLVLFTTE